MFAQEENMTLLDASNRNDANLSDVELDKLYPAIIECFIVILLGFIAGKMNVFSDTESRGISTFCGNFALPSLIFMSMATLDFSTINWTFLLAILVSKILVFVFVSVITLLVTKPHHLGKAGLYSIFCTQSNDFALGYPIVTALYQQTHPDFPNYLYLVAPISLVILNPIGFFMMEMQKKRDKEEDSNCSHEHTRLLTENLSSSLPPLPTLTSPPHVPTSASTVTVFFTIMKNVFLSPIVLMTILGIIGNFAFQKSLPVVLEGVLKVLGSSFSASALFVLGLRMVGNNTKLKCSNLVTPCVLVAVKCMIMPLVMREAVVQLSKSGIGNASDSADLANYGFLYGTFPTAPSVFVFATQYNLVPEMIAGALVASTFLAAPFMFVSAKMITVTALSPINYIADLDAFLFDVAIVGVFCTAWVGGLFLLTRKFKKIPHYFTLCLVISQFIACTGVLLWSVLDTKIWQVYIQFSFIATGVFSARIFTALLAVSIFLLRTRGLREAMKWRVRFAVIGWGLPLIVTVVLLGAVGKETDNAGSKDDPNFQYGRTQAIVASTILAICFLITTISLILQQRYGHHLLTDDQWDEVDSDRGSSIRMPADEESDVPSTRTSVVSLPRYDGLEEDGSRKTTRDSRAMSGADVVTDFSVGEEAYINYDDLNTFYGGDESVEVRNSNGEYEIERSEIQSLFSPISDISSKSQRHKFQRRQPSLEFMEDPELRIVRDRDDEFQILRHVILLLLLCISMFVGLALCLWKLVMEEVTGIYLELLFLDGVLNFGQGFLVFIIFGLDTKLVIIPCLRRWRRWWYGGSRLASVPWDQLPTETRIVCEQFCTFHIEKCRRDLVRDRRWRLQWYTSVFLGPELVDWLIMVGLARDRAEAVRYGKHLLTGGIISHINQEHSFLDQPLFYKFNVEYANAEVHAEVE
ncbi:lysosomal cholesterol signaling protein-like isoform X2 [Artemia franciscana]